MHRSRGFAVAGALTAAAGLALPYATLPPAGAVGGIASGAWLPAAVLGVLLVVVLLGDRGDAPARPAAVAGALLAALALATAIVKFADAWAAADQSGGSVGAGAWLLTAGAVLAAVGAGLGFGRRI